MEIPTEMKNKYLRRRTDDIEGLKRQLECDDFSMAAKLGHQVKGNAKTFDFPHMEALGSDMEIAAKEKNKERVRILMHQLENAINQERVNFPLL
jgi:HPt (histidine-containing phosphotransfer) domain-containing protein